MTLAIDFDRTIHDIDNPLPDRRMGAVLPGAELALEAIRDSGHTIIIHTTRAATPKGLDVVKEWLDYYDLPYSSITATKPNADYYIDDKAIHHTNWDNTLGLIGVDPDV